MIELFVFEDGVARLGGDLIDPTRLLGILGEVEQRVVRWRVQLLPVLELRLDRWVAMLPPCTGRQAHAAMRATLLSYLSREDVMRHGSRPRHGTLRSCQPDRRLHTARRERRDMGSRARSGISAPARPPVTPPPVASFESLRNTRAPVVSCNPNAALTLSPKCRRSATSASQRWEMIFSIRLAATAGSMVANRDSESTRSSSLRSRSRRIAASSVAR
jgi:hypothetical protein